MGGSRGIGFATARAVLHADANVVIAGRNQASLDDAIVQLRSPQLTGARVDGRCPDQVRSFFADLGSINHLVLAFGSDLSSAPFRDLTIRTWRRHFDDKFFAHLLVVQEALPSMRVNGSITLVTGAAARSPAAGAALWAATDGALDAVIPTLALELAPLRVNAVSPGMVDTSWWDRVPSHNRRAIQTAMATQLPVGRIGEPDDIGHAIRFLLENSYITGTVLAVDGGIALAR
ncbi:SDR family oxidoreductase [Nocardia sp. NPDC050630]|uniref:SDR family oxidoreductase n=1 Tax=Nocardia sp. NPDC050630 TaxID=3364321 RepID=UPI003788DF4D